MIPRPGRIRGVLASIFILTLFCAALPALGAALPPLIPKAVLFGGGPSKTGFQVSPDGKQLIYLAPSPAGRIGLWRQTPGKDDASLVTDQAGTLPGRVWGADSRHLFYLADRNGDENFHLYAFDMESKSVRDLTPYDGVKAQNLLIAPNRPDEILVGLNLRDKQVFDMHRIDLKTQAVKPDTENPGNVRWWLADGDLVVRAAVAISAEDASTTLLVRDSAAAPWRTIKTWPFGESGHVEGYGSELAVSFTADGRGLLVNAALDGDLTVLARLDTTTGRVEKVIASDPKACVWTVMGVTLYSTAQVLLHPRTREVQAAGFNYLIPEWKALDAAVAADFEVLRRTRPGVFVIGSRDLEDRYWVVNFLDDDRPGGVYLYDRSTRTPTLLAATNTVLEKYTAAAMEPVLVKSRDGVEIPCYLTLPPGVEPKGLPLVMDIHGGPWARDNWGYDPRAQWLANRGYAVMKVNFRGSDGFGKSFLNAGNGQWGVGVLQNDVTDAVKWAIEKGIADPKRVAITGASYGGYAVLAGLAFTPDLYACGVDLCGMSNVETFIKTLPAWWGPIKTRWIRRIGIEPRGEEANRRISPLFHSDKVKAPLLILHGANDPRVNIAEAEQVVRALREKGRDVEFIVYPDEGHGVRKGPNVFDWLARTETFLAKHLGGRAEPFAVIPGTSAQIR